MKKIGLVVKPNKYALKKADELERWFKNKGVEVFRKENNIPENGYRINLDWDNSKHLVPENLLCVFVLGGDGTFLSASRWIGNRKIPVHGIKFGDVGFLAETEDDAELYKLAEKVISGDFEVEHRMRLITKVFRQNKVIAEGLVLNDVVINKGALARLANIITYIDDNYLTTFRSDGLIISTPTGSTAYSLAAGGPVVHPAVPGVIVTPICPFTLTNRPIILPDSVEIKIKLDDKANDIILTFDGQEGLEIKKGDTILIKKSPFPLELIKLPNRNYFNVLKAKLDWSGGRS